MPQDSGGANYRLPASLQPMYADYVESLRHIRHYLVAREREIQIIERWASETGADVEAVRRVHHHLGFGAALRLLEAQ